MQGLNDQIEEDSKQLMTVLKDFWKTEAIGITDTCQSATEDENFLAEINFVSGQYIYMKLNHHGRQKLLIFLISMIYLSTD